MNLLNGWTMDVQMGVNETAPGNEPNDLHWMTTEVKTLPHQGCQLKWLKCNNTKPKIQMEFHCHSNPLIDHMILCQLHELLHVLQHEMSMKSHSKGHQGQSMTFKVKWRSLLSAWDQIEVQKTLGVTQGAINVKNVLAFFPVRDHLVSFMIVYSIWPFFVSLQASDQTNWHFYGQKTSCIPSSDINQITLHYPTLYESLSLSIGNK